MARILVVDDNAANRALVQATLEDEGYDVVLAEDGPEALKAFTAVQPEGVLLDVRMPGMDGLEVCRQIRALPNGRHTPVVFLTALRDLDTFDAARQAGGDDFLTKPLNPAELVLRVEAALKVAKISQELREHYDLVRNQRDDLYRLGLLKERLTAFLVHDLKNPVAALDLRAQQALRDPELSERGQRSLKQIRDEARALTRMILNLLDISKNVEGKLSLCCSVVELDGIVQEVIAELELKATTAGVRVQLDGTSTAVLADRDLLRRVLVNLVENGIRHAPEDTAVVVAVRPQGNRTQIEVRDSGPGVPAAMKPRIFDPFFQAQSGARVATRTGTGLGLAFCRVAVEAHGGSIRIEDAAPGARFVLDLPATAPETSG